LPGVAGLLAAVVERGDDAVRHHEAFRRHAQLAGRHPDQQAARFRGRIAQGLGPRLHAERARRATLVQAAGGVAHDDVDALEGQVQLLRDDLGDRDLEALAEIDLSEVGRGAAVGMDRDPRVQLAGGERRLGAGAVLAERRAGGEGHGSGNDERAGAEEEFTPAGGNR
jgi:hypothetical protein